MRAVLGATTLLIGITATASAATTAAPREDAVRMLLIGAGLLFGSLLARRRAAR